MRISDSGISRSFKIVDFEIRKDCDLSIWISFRSEHVVNGCLACCMSSCWRQPQEFDFSKWDL